MIKTKSNGEGKQSQCNPTGRGSNVSAIATNQNENRECLVGTCVMGFLFLNRKWGAYSSWKGGRGKQKERKKQKKWGKK